MIAVVTSTIKPSSEYNHKRSFYSFEERLEQTKNTLRQLENHGFEQIFLIDNSPLLDQSKLQQLLDGFAKLQLYHIQEYQFDNKGINELLMLLYLSKVVPKNQNILKISSRYYPYTTFKKPIFVDFAVKDYDFNSRTGTISTRAYWIRDAQTLNHFLLNCLDEVFTYPKRITGIRSLYNQLGQLFLNKAIKPINVSIEFAAANVIKKGNYNITFLEEVGIEGLVAGSDRIEKIRE